MAKPHIVIVGGGTAGLATAWALARRGVASTVLERHRHIHDYGSHGGDTRIIRQAYHEGSDYVPLVQEADELWLELGARTNRTLLVRTGLLEFGPLDDPEFAAAIEACRHGHVEYELVSATEARRRWPFAIPQPWTACFTPSGGYLRVADCMNALRDEALAAGASFRYGVTIDRIVRGQSHPSIVTSDGDTITADRIVVCAGVGIPKLLGETLPNRLICMRRVLAWSRPAPSETARLADLPVWGAFVPNGFFYGFPLNDLGAAGLKLACHTSQSLRDLDQPVDPQAVDRQIHAADLDPLREFIRHYFPSAQDEFVAHKVCMYCTSPSWDFLVDRDPDDPNIVWAGSLSGHGFKFAPTIGRLASELALDDSASPRPAFSFEVHRTTQWTPPTT